MIVCMSLSSILLWCPWTVARFISAADAVAVDQTSVALHSAWKLVVQRCEEVFVDSEPVNPKRRAIADR